MSGTDGMVLVVALLVVCWVALGQESERDRPRWISALAKCQACGHQWRVIRARDVVYAGLRCPQCRELKGRAE